MNIGVPKEIKNNEFRVAITPAGVKEFVNNGHSVFIETNAGSGSAISDADYQAVGATILNTADEIWKKADLILKVKEPIAAEYSRMRKDQVLFTTRNDDDEFDDDGGTYDDDEKIELDEEDVVRHKLVKAIIKAYDRERENETEIGRAHV